MQCPHCQQDHPDNTQVCPNTALPIGRAMICPNCGKESRPGSRFCAVCGASLPKKQIQNNPVDARESPDSTVKPSMENSEDVSPIQIPDLNIPVRKPAPAQPPVILDGAAAAWTAIPTGPRPTGLVSAEPQRSSSVRYIFLAAIILIIITGLFFLLRGSGSPVIAGSTPSFTVTDPVLPVASSTTGQLAVLESPTAIPVGPTDTPPATIPPLVTDTPGSPVIAPNLATEAAQSTQSVVETTTAQAYRLAFVSYNDGDPAVYLLDPDHPADWTPVPFPIDYELGTWPTFCGERVAYEAVDRSLNLPRWIYLYNPNDKSIEPLTVADKSPDRTASPGCSPSGKYMSFAALRNGRWYLDLIELATGKQLYEQPAREYLAFGYASWPMAEDQFLWMGAKATGYFDINRTGNLSHGNIQTTRVLEGRYPAISPDGTMLAYFCGNLTDLCVARWPSGVLIYQIRISYFKQINEQPAPATVAWSQDGQWIYYSSSLAGNWDIYRMHADGSNPQNLTESSTSDELMPAVH